MPSSLAGIVTRTVVPLLPEAISNRPPIACALALAYWGYRLRPRENHARIQRVLPQTVRRNPLARSSPALVSEALSERKLLPRSFGEAKGHWEGRRTSGVKNQQEGQARCCRC